MRKLVPFWEEEKAKEMALDWEKEKRKKEKAKDKKIKEKQAEEDFEKGKIELLKKCVTTDDAKKQEDKMNNRGNIVWVVVVVLLVVLVIFFANKANVKTTVVVTAPVAETKITFTSAPEAAPKRVALHNHFSYGVRVKALKGVYGQKPVDVVIEPGTFVTFGCPDGSDNFTLNIGGKYTNFKFEAGEDMKDLVMGDLK